MSSYKKILAVALFVAISAAAVVSNVGSDLATIARAIGTNTGQSLGNAKSHSHRFSFHDDFNYLTLDQLQASGWALCSGGPTLGHYGIGNGLLNLTNDGVAGAMVCYNNVPAEVNSWTVSGTVRWDGGPYGSLEIIVRTASHIFRWDADGYYNQYLLLRDDVNGYIPVFTVDGYTPQLNTWHTLRIDGSQTAGISMFFDGHLIGVFKDAAGTDYRMTGISLMAGWESAESWDSVTAGSA